MARITYRKTRKGETIDIRADEGEDLRGIIEEMAKPAEPTVISDSITDEQIRALRNTKRSVEHWNMCDCALRNASAWDRIARARCADIINGKTITDAQVAALKNNGKTAK